MRNVKADGNCGYHAVISALKHIKRECKDTVREVRRDIRELGQSSFDALNLLSQIGMCCIACFMPYTTESLILITISLSRLYH